MRREETLATEILCVQPILVSKKFVLASSNQKSATTQNNATWDFTVKTTNVHFPQTSVEIALRQLNVFLDLLVISKHALFMVLSK